MGRATRMLILAGGGLVILVLTARFWTAEQARRTDTAPASPERERIRRFWNLTSAANQQRLGGNFEEAVRLYQESLQLNPQHEDSIYYLGASLEELGEYPEAASAYRSLAELNPSSSRAFAQLGAVLSLAAPGATRDFDGAREAFERMAALNPEHSGSSLNLGLLSLDQGNLEEAQQHFQTASRFGSAAGTFWLGYTHYLRGEQEQAASFFRQVLDVYEHERKIAAQGAALEGDILPGGDQPLTAQQRAVLGSLIFLELAAGKTMSGGGHIHAPAADALEWKAVPVTRSSPPGGRAGWADYDNDGHPDLAVGGNGQPFRLLRNTSGGFIDVTQSVGLDGISNVWDVVWADIDRDGDQDLYMVRPGYFGRGENQLFQNDGKGRFADITPQARLGGEKSTIKALFADLDSDGMLDLVEVGSPSAETRGVRVYRNQGKSFAEVAESWGVAPAGTVVDCAVIDFDADGLNDLFFLRWKRSAVLYQNVGNGRFKDATAQANLDDIGGDSLSVVAFDFDRNERTDLLITHHAEFQDVLRHLRNPDFRRPAASPGLFRNTTEARFEDVSEDAGLFGIYGTVQALEADIDGDGWPDLLLANGSLDGRRLEASVVLRNQSGKNFRPIALLPGGAGVGNYLGISKGGLAEDGSALVYLAGNPIFGRREFPTGVFGLTPASKSKPSPNTGSNP